MPESDVPTEAGCTSIVLADNDRLILEAIGELLRSKGYEVQVAEDGLAAWHLIRQTRPTYIVLDVVMPKLDGSQVCWLVRRDPVLRNTPIVAPIQACALVDEGRCTGVLLILETTGAPVAAASERADPAAGRSRGTGTRGSARA